FLSFFILHHTRLLLPLFLLTLPPPPRPPLFPYTTLFRSRLRSHRLCLRHELLDVGRRPCQRFGLRGPAVHLVGELGKLLRALVQDRKSTRLNSVTRSSRMPSSA